ncbi:MAG: Predicted L-rhamnose ABC transporter, transmembrane component 1, partial [uncultured Rubrobacteraceae bacterium]
ERGHSGPQALEALPRGRAARGADRPYGRYVPALAALPHRGQPAQHLALFRRGGAHGARDDPDNHHGRHRPLRRVERGPRLGRRRVLLRRRPAPAPGDPVRPRGGPGRRPLQRPLYHPAGPAPPRGHPGDLRPVSGPGVRPVEGGGCLGLSPLVRLLRPGLLPERGAGAVVHLYPGRGRGLADPVSHPFRPLRLRHRQQRGGGPFLRGARPQGEAGPLLRHRPLGGHGRGHLHLAGLHGARRLGPRAGARRYLRRGPRGGQHLRRIWDHRRHRARRPHHRDLAKRPGPGRGAEHLAGLRARGPAPRGRLPERVFPKKGGV